MAAIGSLIQAGGNGATFPVVHHGDSAAPRVSCRVEGCLSTFKNQQAMNFHLHSHTEEERAALFPVSPRPATPSGPFHCGSPGCKIQPGGKTLKTFASATSHVIREHASKTLHCTVPDCGALFVLRRDLRKHTKSKHGVGCKCLCRLTLKSKSSLKRHVKMASKTKSGHGIPPVCPPALSLRPLRFGFVERNTSSQR